MGLNVVMVKEELTLPAVVAEAQLIDDVRRQRCQGSDSREREYRMIMI